MDTKILNTKKEELLKRQTEMLAKAFEAKVKLTPEEKTQFDAITAEVDEISADIKRIEVVNKGKLEIASPRQTAALNTEIKSKGKFMAFAGSYKPSKVLDVNEDYVNSLWKACKTQASF